MSEPLSLRLAAARQRAEAALRTQRLEDGGWEGHLSSSALATATALFALRGEDGAAAEIEQALAWIARHQNADGGWGDCPTAPSNLSATLLVWAALSLDHAPRHATATRGAEAYLIHQTGGLEPDRLIDAVLAFYAKDRTFSVPILTLCALAGRLGPEPGCWTRIPPLPFELAALPRGLFRFLRLQVVSYALPALIGMGLAHHRRSGGAQSPRRALRNRLTPRVLRLLERLQPSHGGFLDAAPLTAFVAMSLQAAGFPNHPVACQGVAFLRATQRPDGSWPIDTHLASWVTALAADALGPTTNSPADSATQTQMIETLLSRQHRVTHPFTGSAPGGWAWTPRPGGVPDADDTAGALILLAAHADPRDPHILGAAGRGLCWLLDLQNRDGGIPTFCRGWGRLPFDQSAPDLTAHALRAWAAWKPHLPGPMRTRLDRAAARAHRYLARVQRADGCWIPLWFGHPEAPRQENPVYGTAQVLSAGDALPPPLAEAGCRGLLALQRADGGWGCGAEATIEETAMALSALAHRAPSEALERGAARLLELTQEGTAFPPAPIGLYFASLWYTEALYPLTHTVKALRALENGI